MHTGLGGAQGYKPFHSLPLNCANLAAGAVWSLFSMHFSLRAFLLLSVALLLEHFGYAEAAQRINVAVAADLGSRGDAVRRTSEIGDAIVARLS